MGRVMSFDFGLKRTGIAVTDPLQIIATGLNTIGTELLMGFIKEYIANETVEKFVVGMPYDLYQRETDNTVSVRQFIQKLRIEFPTIPVETIDERFTSKIAVRSMVFEGRKKKDRQKKENIDMISATLILQTYLEQNS